MNKTDLISIRDRDPNDDAFILSTWLKGILYGGLDFYSKIPKDVFFSNHHRILERLLSLPTTTTKIACLKDDPDVILGYTVYRVAGGVTVLDYIFVKKSWRGIGIAKSLAPPNVNAVTNLTKAAEAILSKCPNIVFNPYLM